MRILRTVGKTFVEVIVLDAVISSEITHSITITEHPIEDGGLIADHVRSAPVQVTITGLVTNSPVVMLGYAVLPSFDATRRQTAYEALRALEQMREAVQIETELRVFPDMVMSDLRVPRNRQNFDALEFTATFRHVQKVGLQTVALKDEEQVKALATPATDVGRQEAPAASARQSYAAQAYDYVFGR